MPSSFKDITLFFRQSLTYNSSLIKKPNKKILVKQSYIFLMWINYFLKLNINKDTINNNTSSPSSIKKKIPSFFIHPCRNYKTTITKAPMAHKTFSQEQFMIRYYKLSLSFKIKISSFLQPNNINKIIFFSNMLQKNIPFVGTNMLFLHRYSILFYSHDYRFFSFFKF